MRILRLMVVAVLCISISQAQSFCESNTSDGTGLCTSQTLSIGSSRGSPGRPGLASSTRPESYSSDRRRMAAITTEMNNNRALYQDLNGQKPSEKSDQETNSDGRRQLAAANSNSNSNRNSNIAGPSFAIPSVSNCGERCFWYKPYWVYVRIGFSYHWVRVVQLPWFMQWVRWCHCTNQYCSGRTSFNQWWFGRCVRERSWRKILVIYNWQLRWVWMKYDNGCCCVPWGFA